MIADSLLEVAGAGKETKDAEEEVVEAVPVEEATEEK